MKRKRKPFDKTSVTGFLLLLIATVTFIGCREADFRTIDEIRVVTPDEVHGQTGYLMQFHFEKQGIVSADRVVSRAILLFRDADISWYNFYIDITVDTERNDPQAAEILELFGLLARSTGLSIIDNPNDGEIPPLWTLGEGAVVTEFFRGLVINAPSESVLLRLNLAFKESLIEMVERALRDDVKVIDLGLTPTEPPPVEPTPDPPMTIAEERARDQLHAWDVEREQDLVRLLPPPRNTPRERLDWVLHWLGASGFDSEFGFKFEKRILIDIPAVLMGERPDMLAALKNSGVIVHPLSRNGLVYEYVRIQHAYPDENWEGHLAHFRQSVRNGTVQISRDGPTDIVPAGQGLIWEAQWFPEASFLTPVAKTERFLRTWDQRGHELPLKHPATTPLDWIDQTALPHTFGINIDYILTEIFYVYRQEQPARAAVVDRDGMIIHPISRNNLLYAWIALFYQYPDKTYDELLSSFRQVARQGLEVHRPALTNIVPPGNTIVQFPTPGSFLSPAERDAMQLIAHYDQQVITNGGGKENLGIIFLLANSNELNDYFTNIFEVRVEFVFHTLWNIYKAEQPALAAQIEPQGLIIHPLSRNGLLYEWLRIRYEYPDRSEAERLMLFRQSARQGAIQVNRDGPTDLVPPEGTVRIRPPGENELVNQGLVLP